MRSRTEVSARTLDDLGIERKPFYTAAEVARVLGVSDQSVLDRIHLPSDDPRHLYALALGPRTYRIPMGALAQLVGISPRITVGKRPRRIDDAVADEAPPTVVRRGYARER